MTSHEYRAMPAPPISDLVDLKGELQDPEAFWKEAERVCRFPFKIAWFITEEIGIVVLNDYAVEKVEINTSS